MLARATACSVHGLAGVPVMVEADVANGLPNFTIVGLTDRAIQEARERVRASIRNAGFQFPQRRLVRPFLGLGDLFEAAPQLLRSPPARRSTELAAQPDRGLCAGGDPLLHRVLEQVGADPVHPDELSATLRVASHELATALTTLQLRGAITEVCGGRVARTF